MSIQTQIESAIYQFVLDCLQQEHPDRHFKFSAQGELVVDGVDVVQQKVETAYSGGQDVTGHYRRKKGGGYTWIQSHVRQNTMPSALELAQLEAQEEESPTVGFSIEDTLQKCMEALRKPNSLQRYL
jgi:hypothetical protein|tara:strand:+ start:4215 stop:4595 length:381 start_codon:yes stop_codon:yes gene_type:complete